MESTIAVAYTVASARMNESCASVRPSREGVLSLSEGGDTDGWDVAEAARTEQQIQRPRTSPSRSGGSRSEQCPEGARRELPEPLEYARAKTRPGVSVKPGDAGGGGEDSGEEGRGGRCEISGSEGSGPPGL
eukprot:6200980-Pleurochrysis_carterae.AAC.1